GSSVGSACSRVAVLDLGKRHRALRGRPLKEHLAVPVNQGCLPALVKHADGLVFGDINRHGARPAARDRHFLHPRCRSDVPGDLLGIQPQHVALLAHPARLADLLYISVFRTLDVDVLDCQHREEKEHRPRGDDGQHRHECPPTSRVLAPSAAFPCLRARAPGAAPIAGVLILRHGPYSPCTSLPQRRISSASMVTVPAPMVSTTSPGFAIPMTCSATAEKSGWKCHSQLSFSPMMRESTPSTGCSRAPKISSRTTSSARDRARANSEAKFMVRLYRWGWNTAMMRRASVASTSSLAAVSTAVTSVGWCA